MLYRFIPILLLFCLLITASLSSQSLTLSPELGSAENGEFVYGFEFQGDFKREYTITSETSFPRLLQFELKLNGSVLSKPDFNPDQHTFDLFFGYLISFKKAQDLVLGEEPEPSRDYGSLGIGITTAYEANQTFDEQYIHPGLEIRYINTSLDFLPILELSYEFSKPITSEIRNGLGAEDETYRRFDFRFFWVMRYRQILIHPEFRYHKSYDLDSILVKAGLEEGFHSMFKLGYLNRETVIPILRWLDFIYVQYNYGQLPVYLDDRESFEAGLTFLF